MVAIYILINTMLGKTMKNESLLFASGLTTNT